MRILLVDDDTGVIQALLAILKTMPGHEVKVATNGGKALENAAALGGVDLLITDVVMDPMDGFTLRDHMVSRYPDVRTILISGYDLSDYPEQTKDHQLLTKPIDSEELLAAIAREMSAPPAEPEPPARPAAAVPVPVPSPMSVVDQPTMRIELPPELRSGPSAPPSAPAAPRTVSVPQPSAVPPPTAPATVRVSSTTRIQPIPAPSVPQANVRPVARAATGVPAAPPTVVPKAKPTAPPAPAPKANPTAPPAPAPKASPTAVPSAVRTVKATAIPAAMAAPKAVSAVPKAPSAVPVPRAAAPPPPPVDPAPAPEPVAPDDLGELAGQPFGAYLIDRKIAEGRWGTVYFAVQLSINRPVGIEILDANKASDDLTRERFIADARAKAQVQHPSILAVYEAGEADGRYFYAHEYVDGSTLAVRKIAGDRLDEPTALKVLRVAAEGLAYLTSHHIPHQTPDAASISVGNNGQPHLANLATQGADEQPTPEQEIQALGRIMLSVLPAIQSLSPGFRDLLKGMVQTGTGALTSWGQVLQGIKAIEPKVIPVEAAKISAQDRAAIAAVELARKQQKRALYFSIASVISLVILICVLVYWLYSTNERGLDEQVDIPAGEFLFANGETKNLPEFWIDKYEVTIGQYAKFVKFLENHNTAEYDDPRQPRIKNAALHKPENWDIYYRNAVAGKAAHSVKIDLNCPAITVDFWDAYAYAKWKGRELPTEVEWEKAARGIKGFTYPWGEEFDPKKVNSGADFNEGNPAAKGAIDGFNFWNPVDKIKGDKSPFGVIGMAGNVREWTSTWDPAKHRPVVKGGSYLSKEVRLDQRAEMDPGTSIESIGFRTISHTPPPAKK
ncbi:MAG: SUMF1/EgtB/PvdO family nonheme iron enzyme [Chthoniobacter sp.]|uniref:SUMF1/EgtB/PvdO family nonheme iron enzyme n=1 Tax=Chthoniobacter sp. TaxID=2510640 RepID=UPI0032ABAB17